MTRHPHHVRRGLGWNDTQTLGGEKMTISERIRKLLDECRKLQLHHWTKELQAIADELDASPNPKWFWGRPDKVGVYAAGGLKKETIADRFDVHPVRNLENAVVAWWAYYGPILTPDPPDKPKKYRTPGIADMGKQCEFWDCNVDDPTTATLMGYIHNSHGRCWKDERGQLWDNCRIEVTE